MGMFGGRLFGIAGKKGGNGLINVSAGTHNFLSNLGQAFQGLDASQAFLSHADPMVGASMLRRRPSWEDDDFKKAKFGGTKMGPSQHPPSYGQFHNSGAPGGAATGWTIPFGFEQWGY